MVNPVRVDAAIDLAYGALILLAILLITTFEVETGLAFGLGVFSAYILHVVWKMARFDPEWMTQAVEETVEETVTEQLETVQEQVEAVDERVDRRPREDQVEELIEDSVEDERSR